MLYFIASFSREDGDNRKSKRVPIMKHTVLYAYEPILKPYEIVLSQ
jgi:hypothetical protein